MGIAYINKMIPIADKETQKRLQAKYSHEKFMEYTWQNTSEKFLVGLHTKEICRLIDEAIEDFRHGKSTFLVVKLPFRHGKSQMLSRYLPPHFLGEFPDNEVMLVTYASSLAEGFSRYARSLMRSAEYKSLYPNVEISKTNGGVQQWGIENHTGVCTASGLGSGITGKGYHLGLCDDYCASRQDAESETIRNSTWEHFTNDFLTRRAPTSITIVLATQWHVDDIIGRIEQKVNPESPNYDKDFPQFKIVSFPAMNGEADIGVKDFSKYGDRKYHLEHIKYNWLFPERFTEDWYRQQFASLGEYASAGLLQCNPTTRGGNVLKVGNVQFHNSLSEFPHIRYDRIWDLAHSEKQTQKADPDWTSGTLIGFRKVGQMWEVWIKDVARIRATAPERDNFIHSVALKDGGAVQIGVEISIDARDTILIMQKALKGQRRVIPIKTTGDKVTRMSYLEPCFEASNVHILRADWNLDWLKEAKEFPSGKHDDQMDNISAGYELRVLSCNQVERVRLQGV